MTFDLFLRCYGFTCVGVALVTWWSFPFDPVRRWLAAGPYLVTDDYGNEWRVIRQGQTLGVFGSRREAAKNLRESDRVRAWLDDLTTCPFCFGAWASAVVLAAVAISRGDAGLLWWWPLLWWLSSVSVAVVKAGVDG